MRRRLGRGHARPSREPSAQPAIILGGRVGRLARTGLRMMPTFPSPSLNSLRRVFPSTASRPACQVAPARSTSRLSLLPACRLPRPVCLDPSHASAAGVRPGAVSRSTRAPRAAVREVLAPLPQGSLAPVRVLLSRSLIAYSDPIRQSRRHAGISRPCRLYPAPSLCGSASATRETFPTFPAALSIRAVDPTPVGPRPRPVVWGPRCQASSCYDRVATHETRLCQQCPTG
jgi:hypothetical protein